MTNSRQPLTRTAMEDNLRAIRASATDAHVLEGRGWYPTMGGMIAAVADESREATGDRPTDALAVGVFAAFSQNATWKANVTMATRYLAGEGRGMASVLAECEAMEEGADPTDAETLGLKRADFCANLLGDMSRVTCDRWHLRAAFALASVAADDLSDAPKQIGRTRDRKTARWVASVTLTSSVHADVTAATRTVAAEYGETPAACQAIIWCAVRGTGA